MRRGNLLFVVLLILVVSCRQREVKISSPEIVRVRVRPVERQAVRIPVHASGILVSSEEVKLSFKTGGIVSKVAAEEGERVKKGDLLASLDLTEISANENQTRLVWEKARRDYTRAQNLYSENVGTLEQNQNLQTALNVAELAHKVAKFNLEHAVIVAPDNGVVLKQMIRENEMVSPGYPAFLFGSSGKYWKVKAGLSDKDIIKINPGDSASVSFDAYPGVAFPAKVDQVGEMSNPYTGTFEAELLLAATGYRLVSGFIGSVELFPPERRLLLMVPVESIIEADGNQGYVYSVDSIKQVRKLKIEIVTIAGNRAAIKGLPDGINEVVNEGAAYLRDGMTVEIIK
jgi:membrane fusion protein, multidrug efflux system